MYLSSSGLARLASLLQLMPAICRDLEDSVQAKPFCGEFFCLVLDANTLQLAR
jgi:hypothetical protein